MANCKPLDRVIKALNHEKSDRVPLFYRDVPEVEQRLIKDLGLKDREELLKYLEIDFRWVEPDYISPDLWSDRLRPGLKAMANVIKRYGAYYYLHSCGSVKKLIPHFIELGVDVLDPVQVKASGMVPSELKKEFGDKICFSGGVDEQELLPTQNPIKVKEEVFKLLDDMAYDGGFFIGPTHNFQDDIPTENILAMYEAAKEWK